jgi:glyoxylase-like metal-dependent hydrolase (beta-lactamase superfamily II)
MNHHADLIDYGQGIYALDAGYLRPGLAAVHLIVQTGRVALVDSGTQHSVPAILSGLQALGLDAEAVDYVLLTHVHLDHAGAAGALMARCPNARLVVHPRGAPHMVDPTRLVAGATAVYGAQTFRALYGDILPVAADRVIEAGDGFELDFHGRSLAFLDTPGHARHHLCIYDAASRGVFTGDAFGLSYREFDVDGRPFVFPTTTPVQFEPEAAHASIDRIMALGPSVAYLTHFGRVTDLPRLAGDLHALLDAFVCLAEAAPEEGARRHAWMVDKLESLLISRLRQHGCQLNDAAVRELLRHDVELNAQGLGIWLDRRLDQSPASVPSR